MAPENGRPLHASRIASAVGQTASGAALLDGLSPQTRTLRQKRTFAETSNDRLSLPEEGQNVVKSRRYSR